MTTRSRTNPLLVAQRRTRRLWVIAAPALAVAGFWALRAPDREPIIAPPINPPSQESPNPVEASTTVDRNVFAVNLWHAPPQPEEPKTTVAEAPPAASLKLSLIGIISEDGANKAVLYDADNDRLLILADGEAVRDHTVRIVGGANGLVELSNGTTTTRLVLRPDKEAPGS